MLFPAPQDSAAGEGAVECFRLAAGTFYGVRSLPAFVRDPAHGRSTGERRRAAGLGLSGNRGRGKTPYGVRRKCGYGNAAYVRTGQLGRLKYAGAQGFSSRPGGFLLKKPPRWGIMGKGLETKEICKL